MAAISLTDLMRRENVTAALGTMRKPQSFTVYPVNPGGAITVQSEKSIGRFDPRTGEGVLNVKGSNFLALARATRFTFPASFVAECIRVSGWTAGDPAPRPVELPTSFVRPCATLAMRKFTVTVHEVPSAVEVALFGAQTTVREVEVEGYTLEDAKRRAGII